MKPLGYALFVLGSMWAGANWLSPGVPAVQDFVSAISAIAQRIGRQKGIIDGLAVALLGLIVVCARLENELRQAREAKPKPVEHDLHESPADNKTGVIMVIIALACVVAVTAYILLTG